jgi:hypothetical protein
VSNEGENILKLVRQMRQLCEQISLLLRTVDEQMTKADWNSETNTAIADSSSSILNPAYWIPIVIFRFYRHKDCPNRLRRFSAYFPDTERASCLSWKCQDTPLDAWDHYGRHSFTGGNIR